MFPMIPHIEKKEGRNMTHRRWFNGLRSRAAIGIAVLGLVASMTLAVTAGTGAATAGAATKYTITLIPGLTTDPFYITMHYGAIQEAKKLGVTLKWAGATTWNLELQIPVVKSVLASKPNALLIAPTDDVALFNPIDQYVKAGIPAFTYWSIGLNRATSSVGAMRRALGLLASTDLTTGICSSKFQVVAPAHLRVTPSFLASWIAP